MKINNRKSQQNYRSRYRNDHDDDKYAYVRTCEYISRKNNITRQKRRSTNYYQKKRRKKSETKNENSSSQSKIKIQNAAHQQTGELQLRPDLSFKDPHFYSVTFRRLTTIRLGMWSRECDKTTKNRGKGNRKSDQPSKKRKNKQNKLKNSKIPSSSFLVVVCLFVFVRVVVLASKVSSNFTKILLTFFFGWFNKKNKTKQKTTCYFYWSLSFSLFDDHSTDIPIPHHTTPIITAVFFLSLLLLLLLFFSEYSSDHPPPPLHHHRALPQDFTRRPTLLLGCLLLLRGHSTTDRLSVHSAPTHHQCKPPTPPDEVADDDRSVTTYYSCCCCCCYCLPSSKRWIPVACRGRFTTRLSRACPSTRHRNETRCSATCGRCETAPIATRCDEATSASWCGSRIIDCLHVYVGRRQTRRMRLLPSRLFMYK